MSAMSELDAELRGLHGPTQPRGLDMVLVSDLADRGENPAEYPYDCRLEVDPEEHKAIICWTENLAFHAELALRDEARFPGTQTNTWDSLTADGWLTGAAQQKLSDELSKLLGGLDVYLDENNYDEPNVTFEVVTDYLEGETYQAWLDRIGWHVVATLINSTDPGTFMFPYLFSVILYHEV